MLTYRKGMPQQAQPKDPLPVTSQETWIFSLVPRFFHDPKLRLLDTWLQKRPKCFQAPRQYQLCERVALLLMLLNGVVLNLSSVHQHRCLCLVWVGSRARTTVFLVNAAAQPSCADLYLLTLLMLPFEVSNLECSLLHFLLYFDHNLFLAGNRLAKLMFTSTTKAV